MVRINSVCGYIDSSDLGFTLMHEHILVASAGTYRDYPELFGKKKVPDGSAGDGTGSGLPKGSEGMNEYIRKMAGRSGP